MKNKILNKKVALGVSVASLLASSIALPFTTNLFNTMEALEAKINISLLIAFLALTSMLSFFVYKGATTGIEAAEENEQISDKTFIKEFNKIDEEYKLLKTQLGITPVDVSGSPAAGMRAIDGYNEYDSKCKEEMKLLFNKAHTIKQVEYMKKCKFYSEIMNEDRGLLDKVKEIEEKDLKEKTKEFNRQVPTLSKEEVLKHTHSLT